MKRKIVLVASILSGLAAALLTHVYLASKEAEVQSLKNALETRYGTMWVLCYARDAPAGTVLAREDFKQRKVPAVGMRGQALTEENLHEVVGRKTQLAHREKDVVFWSDIEGGDPKARGLSGQVKKLMRAISINCSGSASVSSMVRANDHVDVIGTFDFEGASGKGNLVTCTILQNVLVLATGSEDARLSSARLSSSGYSTVTLEVTPREAEMLAFAEQVKGRLVLTLRNRNDTSYERELPSVDFKKIKSEIEELNLKRQREKLSSGHS